MVAIARESLNISDASGSIADPLVWDRGSKPKARRIGDRVVVDLAVTSFLSTPRWPEGLNEMGKFGVSYLELLVLFEK